MLGDVYNNNKNDRKTNDPTVYSPYKFSTVDGLDPSSLSITFWASTMKISIAPKKNTPNGEIAYDYDNGISIYLSHTKARILAEEIKAFMEGKINNVAVDTAKGLISISNGKEFGVNSNFLVIRSFDQENNTVSSSYAYEFKKQYHYSIRNFDEKNMDKFEKVYYDDIEIWQFVTLLEEYYKAMTGAVAFTVIDQSKYNNSRVQTKLDSIASKLGIDWSSNNGNKSSGGASFFSNKESNGSSSFKTGSVDDLDDLE